MNASSSSRRVPRWIVPSRRRFVRALVVALALAGVVWATQPLWSPLVAQWQYWVTMQKMQDASGAGKQPRFLTHPLSTQFPFEGMLLDNGAWATPNARQAIEKLRTMFPQDATDLDYYRACWELWSGDLQTARKELARLGRPIDPVRWALRTGDIEELRRLAMGSMSEPAGTQAAEALIKRANETGDLTLLRWLGNQEGVTMERRARAWHEASLLARRQGKDTQADDDLLSALEVLGKEGVPALQAGSLPETVKQEARQRLGHGIDLARYRQALTAWAQRTQDPAELEELFFELGKLKMLARLETKGEAKP